MKLKMIDNSTHPVHKKYMDLVEDADLSLVLEQNRQKFLTNLAAIPAEKHDYAYAAGKWTIKQIIQHLIDTERIFAYRALRFARADKTPLAGFDEDEYAKIANTQRSWESLVKEWDTVRQATICLYDSFSEEDLDRKGVANGIEIFVSNIAFATTGHTIHHWNTIQERYLKIV